MIMEAHDRLREARLKAGYETAEAGAAAVNTPVSTYRSLENGTRGISKDHAIKFGKRFGVSPVWILFGSEFSAEHVKPRNGGKTADNGVSLSASEHGTYLEELDVRAGAGAGGILEAIEQTDHNGLLVSKEAVLGQWQMPDYFTRGTLRIDPTKAIVLEVFGDSGYDPENSNALGSLLPGDRVIIDTNDKRPSPPGAFALFDGIGIVVKLVEPIYGSDPPRLKLSSRNPQYAAYEVTLDEAHIIGRVRGRITMM